MAPIRRIRLDSNSMTLLSGLLVYVKGRRFAGEALEKLKEYKQRQIITDEVYQVGESILTGNIPADSSPEVRETAEYYLAGTRQ